jgi:hypothetical protein
MPRIVIHSIESLVLYCWWRIVFVSMKDVDYLLQALILKISMYH